MLFNSPEFLFAYLPLVLLGFWLVNNRWSQHTASYLAVVSLVFYGWWDWRYVPLLCASIIANWWLGQALMAHPTKAKLVAGVAANLTLLGVFKYAGFFARSVDALLPQPWIPVIELALPLGISFFTFTQIAFLVDCARGEVKERHFPNYLLFVTFFPHLIAGPVLHHREMMPQFTDMRGKFPDGKVVSEGLWLLTAGLFKKVVVADALGRLVDPAFSNAAHLHILEAWTAALAYALQLYFDFSAYSEMAMGLGLLLGIRLPLNFNSPYKAVDIGDFWRRWHMTLGRFLRDYLYIPLGGNRRGFAHTLAALLATMVLGGLWHGAAWTFVLWGTLHGLALVAHRVWVKLGGRMGNWAGRLLTFAFVVVAWVPFRATSISDTWAMYRAMFGGDGLVLPQLFGGLAKYGVQIELSPLITGIELLPLLILVEVCMVRPNVHEVWQQRITPKVRYATAIAAMWLVSVMNLNHVASFAYWNNF